MRKRPMVVLLSWYNNKDDSRFAPSQRETALLCNDVARWLGANLESTLNNSACWIAVTTDKTHAKRSIGQCGGLYLNSNPGKSCLPIKSNWVFGEPFCSTEAVPTHTSNEEVIFKKRDFVGFRRYWSYCYIRHFIFSINLKSIVDNTNRPYCPFIFIIWDMVLILYSSALLNISNCYETDATRNVLDGRISAAFGCTTVFG